MATKYIRNTNSMKCARIENEVEFRDYYDRVYGDRARYAYFESDDEVTPEKTTEKKSPPAKSTKSEGSSRSKLGKN